MLNQYMNSIVFICNFEWIDKYINLEGKMNNLLIYLLHIY